MTIETIKNRKINEHVNYSGGTKTVCVSTCLNYFGISPDKYTYTSSNRNMFAYENVLRKFGYNVRSRATEFNVKSRITTMTELRNTLKRSKYNKNDMFIVFGIQAKVSHLMVLNGNGEIVIDTSPKSKWKILNIKEIIKMM